MGDDRPKILYCNCSYAEIIDADKKAEVLQGLRGADVDLVEVDDLCGLAARRDGLFGELAKSGELVVVACFPRAVRWLFEMAGAALRPSALHVHNMRTESAAEIIERIVGGEGATDGKSICVSVNREDDWIPWFPVIDYDRCGNCKQCLSFCLFGAFELVDDRVVVAHPANCKTNCPACARICPEAAIIFPKYPDAPVNGAVVKDDDIERARVKVDMEAVLGDDPYAALMARRKRVKLQLLKRESMESALRQRQSYLDDSHPDG